MCVYTKPFTKVAEHTGLAPKQCFFIVSVDIHYQRDEQLTSEELGGSQAAHWFSVGTEGRKRISLQTFQIFHLKLVSLSTSF